MKCKNCGEEFTGNICPKCGNGPGDSLSDDTSDSSLQQPPNLPVPNSSQPQILNPNNKPPFKIKWWHILIATIILVSIVSGTLYFIFRCDHEWKDATCVELKTCTKCGKTEGELADHKWQGATCTEPKTCSICGKTEGEPLDHEWEEATCKSPKKCSRCGLTEGLTLEHAPGEWTEDISPTYLSLGVSFQHCTVCGELLNMKELYLDSYAKEGKFIFSPKEFCEKANDMFDSIEGCTLTAKLGTHKSEGYVAAIIFDGSNRVYSISFLDDKEEMIKGEDNANIKSVLAMTLDSYTSDYTAEILMALVHSCEPLDFEETRDLSKEILRNGSVDRNNLAYALTIYDGTWMLGVNVAD